MLPNGGVPLVGMIREANEFLVRLTIRLLPTINGRCSSCAESVRRNVSDYPMMGGLRCNPRY